MRLRTFLVSLSLSLLTFSTVASAAPTSFDKPIYLNAQRLQLPAVITADRVLVPMRAYIEAMGGTVSWEPPNRVGAELNGRTVALTLGSTSVTVAGKQVTWDPAPQLVGDLTYVPLRALSEGVGATVEYDGSAVHVTVRPPKVELVIFDGPLNVRTIPSLTAPILTTLPAGTRLEVMEARADWTQVALPRGRTGWVANPFVKLAPPIPSMEQFSAMWQEPTGYLQVQNTCLGAVPIIHGSLYAPVRYVLEQLGGRAMPFMAAAVVTLHGEQFVPARPLADALGLTMTYNPQTGTATMHSPGAASPAVCNPLSPVGAYLILDAATGLVLSESRADEKRLVASTTKIMTALLALEQAAPGSMVVASPKAAATDGSRLGLRTGQRMRLGDMLYGLMLRSGNDAAVAIAEHVAGTEAAFAAAMTARAAELGAVSSSFHNASGLDDWSRPLSTARDMGLITQYAMRDADFRALAGARYYTIPGLARLENRNEFVLKYPGATGVKNGWTPDAGHAVVVSAYQGDREVIVVILGAATRTQLYAEATRLMDRGFGLYDGAWMLKAVR